MTKKAIPLLILLIILPSLLYLTSKSRATPTATIRVDPPVLTGLEIGDTFTINITVTDVTDLYGWEVPLYYKSSVLNATSIKPGPNWEKQPEAFFYVVDFTDNYNATHGRIYAAATLTGEVSGLNGTILLATITFKAIAYGNSPLYLDPLGEPPAYVGRTKLIDSARPFGNEISHNVSQGRVHVGLIDIAIINAQAPLNVPKGQLVLINVTVENQGRVTETFELTVLYDTTPIVPSQTVVNLAPTEIRTYTFPWDTTTTPIGDYRLTATATTFPGETDIEDNTYNIGAIYIGKRIINTHPSKTCTNDTIIYINVTVTNEGKTPTIFNITAYIDANPIETKTNINLIPGATTHLIFTGDTTPLPKGVYTISVTATPGEIFTDGTITETIKGDINGDFEVNIHDLYQSARAFGATPENPRWNPNCDLDNNGEINIKDLYYIARNFGKSI